MAACKRSRMLLERRHVRRLWCSQSKDQTSGAPPDSDTGRLALLFPAGIEMTSGPEITQVCSYMRPTILRTPSPQKLKLKRLFCTIHEDCLPVLHGQRWSVDSSALQWRQSCFLCWTRRHRTCWPASEDFAPKDRYSAPPSRGQPEEVGTRDRCILLFKVTCFTIFLFSHLHLRTTSLGM